MEADDSAPYLYFNKDNKPNGGFITEYHLWHCVLGFLCKPSCHRHRDENVAGCTRSAFNKLNIQKLNADVLPTTRSLYQKCWFCWKGFRKPNGEKCDVIRFYACEWLGYVVLETVFGTRCASNGCANIYDIETMLHRLPNLFFGRCIKSLKVGQLNDFCFGNLRPWNEVLAKRLEEKNIRLFIL